nr:immunoglobulin heavy chain junction region [Macaca mulatta]MPN83419.1 immunoglobulin heavy chain junction region [Macaca mulatta]MPN83422.1 immunoglobulin heavy chain junction region [Macaca mulatta]MPN83454.1 immunoglobulin heavy chain junction region [Macaca mulatta]MPN83668.1 immunoglobulin heavy chain junction region [Macaca mulatta]
CARDRVISRGWHYPFDYW